MPLPKIDRGDVGSMVRTFPEGTAIMYARRERDGGWVLTSLRRSRDGCVIACLIDVRSNIAMWRVRVARTRVAVTFVGGLVMMLPG